MGFVGAVTCMPLFPARDRSDPFRTPAIQGREGRRPSRPARLRKYLGVAGADGQARRANMVNAAGPPQVRHMAAMANVRR
jgi:hypothetical protein